MRCNRKIEFQRFFCFPFCPPSKSFVLTGKKLKMKNLRVVLSWQLVGRSNLLLHFDSTNIALVLTLPTLFTGC